MRGFGSLILLVCVLCAARATHAAAQWLTLPATPTLPAAERAGYAPVNGIKVWYAVFGRGEAVILLHGGLANSTYWGNQVRVLAKRFEVIVMDSRGHGRSTRDAAPIGYDLMASDVLGLMDFLKVRQAAIVGWSDGAIVGLDIAIHHPERLTRLFAFGANSDPDGVKDVARSPIFTAYVARARREYESLSPTPGDYPRFFAEIATMWATQPHFTAEQLDGIATPTWIVDGDHEEAIKRDNTEYMAARIPGSGLLIQPGVSHFSFLQDPAQFNADLLHFLSARP